MKKMARFSSRAFFFLERCCCLRSYRLPLHLSRFPSKACAALLNKYGINHATLQILPVSAGKIAHCERCN